MQIHYRLLEDLIKLCAQLSAQNYTHKSDLLNSASLGEHLRHVYEFYDCLLRGIESGEVNYDSRNRNPLIEKDKAYAIEKLHQLILDLAHCNPNQSLLLFSKESIVEQTTTSVARELLYCLDHAVHHQALMKIGLKELNLYHLIHEDFGVAYSTLRHRKGIEA